LLVQLTAVVADRLGDELAAIATAPPAGGPGTELEATLADASAAAPILFLVGADSSPLPAIQALGASFDVAEARVSLRSRTCSVVALARSPCI
jgi:hypothetical protein